MKTKPMKDRIDRTAENLAEMQTYTTDPQLKELLETVLGTLEDVGDRLDELELEQEITTSTMEAQSLSSLKQEGEIGR
jgi:hypothetical protein